MCKIVYTVHCLPWWDALLLWAQRGHVIVLERSAVLEGCGVSTTVVRMCAGLEGAQTTSWAELAPSEKAAVAYTFIHEEDPLLALKFLARIMASFGGSKGVPYSVC